MSAIEAVEKPAGKAVGWVLLAGICALAVAPFVADSKSRERVPTAEALAEGLAAVRAAYREGDAVRVEPSWWTVPWSGLTGLGSESRTWPFRPLLVSELVDPIEALGHKRLVILSGFGRAAGLPQDIAAAGREQTVLYASETVSVASWMLDGVERLRTLTRDLKGLSVRRSLSGGPLKTCRFSGGKHRCGSESWLDVALEERVVAAREVEWLFVHPGPRGAVLSVEWSGLPRTSEKGTSWLFVRIGPSLDAVRHPEGKEVSVEVAIDGERVDAFAIEPRRFDLERRAIRVPAGTGDAKVTFTITCEDAAWRETMLEADVLDGLPPVLEGWATSITR